VKFGIQVQLVGPALALESNTSNPFIVITNECQYEESDGLVLKMDAFGHQESGYHAMLYLNFITI
jgi:hypothetical protein